jgi:putative SOS response-associated peptidase YedK
MPVILSDATHAEWLSGELADPARVAALIAERAQSAFVYAPVSTVINGRVADTPKLVEPIEL